MKTTAACMICYQTIKSGSYHETCSKKLFGSTRPPHLEDVDHLIESAAAKFLAKRIVITGVQRKLSLHLSAKNSDRFTILGALGGNYILKPQSFEYPGLPENEAATMQMASLFGIQTALSGLVRLKDGSCAYITKRFDRRGKKKLALEDFCQLTETPTEQKYRSSYEKVARTIEKYSHFPGDDKLRLLESLLFCFVTGNADMHLKNYSLLRNQNGKIMLSPAYDLLSTRLVLSAKEDSEEMALTLVGKRSRFKETDFADFANRLKIPKNVYDSVLARLFKCHASFIDLIERSFLPIDLKATYKDLIASRLDRL